MSSPSFSPKETYSPSIPSPLNPFNPETLPGRHRRGCDSRFARKSSGPLSPTQKLMRQKAAAAWRSMVLRNAVLDLARARRELDWEMGRDIGGDAADDEFVTISIEQHHEVDLDIMGLNTEKQPLVDTKDVGDTSSPELAEEPYRWNQSMRVLTTRRLVAVVGMVCVLGILSAARIIDLV
ncbi:hypothetical protein F4779DRAFT_429892 [Xylariaceae sp. FL0662B]|nr:hypothetical protein F4779DRAFT_429892 [Xylariaceae sp. FL0662B]